VVGALSSINLIKVSICQHPRSMGISDERPQEN
jgi:hypothetical protein